MFKLGKDNFYRESSYRYNENGDLAGINKYLANGRLSAAYIWNYDYQEKELSIYTAENGQIKDVFEEYKYNINRDIIKFTGFDSAFFASLTDIYVPHDTTKMPNKVTKYTYNEDGLMASEITYINNDLDTFKKHFYTK